MFHLRKWTKETNKRIPILRQILRASQERCEIWRPWDVKEQAEHLQNTIGCGVRLLLPFSLGNNLWFRPHFVISDILGLVSQSTTLHMKVLKYNHPVRFSRAAFPTLTLLPGLLEWKSFWLPSPPRLCTCLVYNQHSGNTYWPDTEWMNWIHERDEVTKRLTHIWKLLKIQALLWPPGIAKLPRAHYGLLKGSRDRIWSLLCR